MPVVHLVRHGQASFGAADYDALSELGHRQAEVVGKVLAARGLRDPLVVSGALSRQRDTAATLMRTAGIAGAAEVDARWDEYDHVAIVERYGDDAAGAPESASGSAASVQSVLDAALRGWIAADADEPGGWRVFATAGSEALHDLLPRLHGRDGVVVTSGGVIAALCAALLGAGPDGMIRLNRVTVNAGITTLLAGRSGISLLTFNEHAYLPADLRTYR
jgi:broad specificity phosphatase PhoE